MNVRRPLWLVTLSSPASSYSCRKRWQSPFAEMAQEFSPLGLTVNLISPGLIDTARQGRSADRPDHHKHHSALLGRRGLPEEVAAMVRHLVGPRGRYITGQTIDVNRGVYLP